MSIRSIATPWAPAGSRAFCVPGMLILKMRLGEAPDYIPARNDIRDGAAMPATVLDGGALDRLLRMGGGGARVARLHTAAANISRIGRRNCDYSDDEQMTGVARTFVVRTDPRTPIGDLVQRLAAVSTVDWVSPNYMAAAPFDVPLYGAGGSAELVDDAEMWEPWRMIRAPQALAYEPGDSAVIVGVVDSGVARMHPEFARPFRQGYDTVQLGQSDIGPGVELLGDLDTPDHDPVDEFVGHGSACAAIIGAEGLDMPPGLAGQSQMLPMRALGAVRTPGRSAAVGMGSIADLDAAVKLAIDLGARVLNLSFGTDDSQLTPGLPKPHADVIAYGAERGCVFVAASGNNGKEAVYWPAAYPDVIACGAVGADFRPAGFSTKGDHVALCAPGERIFTAALDGYQRATGTSFAAPFVTATAALMIARAERRAFPIEPQLVKRILMATSRAFPEPVPFHGTGVLDAAAAVAAIDAFIDRAEQEEG